MNLLSRLLRSNKLKRNKSKIVDASASKETTTKPRSGLMDLAKDISSIVVSLGAAVGIVGSAFTYILTEKAKRDEAQKTQLTTYKTYGNYLSLYRTDIQPQLGELLKDKERQMLEQDALALRENAKAGSSESCIKLIYSTTTRTGFEAFSSPKHKTYRDVHNYYESIGYALRQGQLDFEIIFDLITLPNYWNIYDPSSSWYRASDDLSMFKSTRTYLYPDFSVMLPLRTCIGDNYYGESKQLHDFSDHIDMLGYNYLFTRMRSLYRRECWPKEDSLLNRFNLRTIEDISSPNRLSSCDVLRRRLQDMKKASDKPAIWMALYSTTQTEIDPPWSIKPLLPSPNTSIQRTG